MSSNKDKAYARCKACDAQFFPKWRKDIQEFEDLCDDCLGKIHVGDDEDREFVHGYLLDKGLEEW